MTIEEKTEREWMENITAEQQLLGAILVGNDRIFQVSSYLKATHFSEPVHQRIYALMLERILAGNIVSPVILKDIFDKDLSLSDVGGGKYLGRLAMFATITIALTPLAAAIMEAAKRRRIVELCEIAIDQAKDVTADRDIEEVESLVFQGIQEIMDDTHVSSFRTDKQVSESIIEAFKSPIICHKTGLPSLDDAMHGGLYPSRMYSFAARMKTGKSMFAATLACNLAQSGIKLAFITAEMDDAELQRRILARISKQFSNSFSNQDREALWFQDKIALAYRQLKGNIVYCYEPSITFDELKQRLHYAVHKLKVKGFILDQWQLVTGKKRHESEASHLSDVAQWLSGFCKKHNVFGIVLCQLNKDGNTLGSEGIKRATDQLYTLNKCEKYELSYWLDLELSRYTSTTTIGSEDFPRFKMELQGPYFAEI